jgi:hypothetical protein
VRNIIVYNDISGSNEGLNFYKGKFPLLDINDPGNRKDFIITSWESFWGRFGWMDGPLPAQTYDFAGLLTVALLLLTIVAALVVLGRSVIQGKRLPAHSVQAVCVMVLITAILLAGYVQFNMTIGYQPQSRYFFPVILAFGLLLTSGLHAMVSGCRWKALALALPILCVAYINYVGLVVVR